MKMKLQIFYTNYILPYDESSWLNSFQETYYCRVSYDNQSCVKIYLFLKKKRAGQYLNVTIFFTYIADMRFNQEDGINLSEP